MFPRRKKVGTLINYLAHAFLSLVFHDIDILVTKQYSFVRSLTNNLLYITENEPAS